MDLMSFSSSGTSNISPLSRTKSPEKSRKHRRSDAVEFGDRTGSSEGLLREGYLNSRNINVGRYSEERTKQKDLITYAAPKQELVDRIIRSVDSKRSHSKGINKLTPLPGIESQVFGAHAPPGSVHSHMNAIAKPMKNNYVSDSTGLIETSQILQIPNARLGFEVPIANNTSMFGSTQLEGCRGDFCDFDVSAVENKELKLNRGDVAALSAAASSASYGAGNGSLNEFRQRLAMQDLSNEDQLKQSSYMTAMIKGDTKHGPKNPAAPATKMVGQNIIIQCRMEMPFVKLQLRRHKNNEKFGDYASEDTYHDLAVGMKLPAHYYNDVPVCETCHKVYNIITTARQKAIVKIEKKLDRQKEQKMKKNHSTADYYAGKRSLDSQKLPLTAIATAPTLDHSVYLETEKEIGIKEALMSVAGLTKHDVAEIRTLNKPHAAVVAVMEAVMTLLTGHAVPFDDMKKLLATGDLFLNLLKEFRLEQVDDAVLSRMECYVDNPVFRPEHVKPISLCASKFCSWVLGVVQAARWQRGMGHKRTNFARPDQSNQINVSSSVETFGNAKQLLSKSNANAHSQSSRSLDISEMQDDGLSFVQRLEQKRNQKRALESSVDDVNGSPTYDKAARSVSPISRKPKPTPKDVSTAESLKHLSQRDMKAFKAAQNKSVNRLSSLVDKGKKLIGEVQHFKCRDGITKMPYVVVGSMALQPTRCNFIVVHDFFDTYDGTCILFKSLAQQHPGCQIVCFNYPGQSNTVWPRPPKIEKDRGAKEPVLNNDYIADRINELLHHIEQDGGIRLSTPFHLVGIGNGACIAAAFCQRWGKDPHYAPGLRSLVSINGFLSPDPQLVGVLHQAAQLFETTPHNRPDIPVSYWARYMFSNAYLEKIHPNLALNIYTAISNPITNDGRYKLATGCINHRDLRAGLAPDADMERISDTVDFPLNPVTVPVLLLQSTENTLVNASNVDPFLKGRTTKHLWSHQQNILSDAVLARAKDVQSQWVGGMSSGPEDYAQFSMLGKEGVKLMQETLSNPRGCFVMWTTAGHLIQQENKRAILDFLDVLACPTEEYTGSSANSGVTFTSKLTVNPNFKSEGLTVGSMKLPDSESLDLSNSFVLTKPSYGTGNIISGRSTPATRRKEIDDDEEELSKTNNELEFTITPIQLSTGLGSTAATDISMLDNKDSDEVAISPRATTAGTASQSVNNSRPSSSHFVTSLKRKIDGDDSVLADSNPDSSNKHSVTTSIPVSPISTKKSADSSVSPTPALAAHQDRRSVSPVSSPKSNGSVKSSRPHSPTPALSPTVQQRKAAGSSTTPLPDKSVQSITSPGKVVHENIHSVSKANNAGHEADSVAVSSTKVINLRPDYPELPIRGTVAAANNAPATSSTAKSSIIAHDPDLIATRSEQVQRNWAMSVPDAHEVMELEGEIALKQKQFLELKAKHDREKIEEEVLMVDRLKREQYLRAKKYEEEDRLLMEKLEKELADRRRERSVAEKQRLLEIQMIDQKLVQTGVVEAHKGISALSAAGDANSSVEVSREPISELPPLLYQKPIDLPVSITDGLKAVNPLHQLDALIEDEKDAKKKGIMSVDEYDKVKRQMAQRQMERDQKLRNLAQQEQHALFENSAASIQRIARGYIGRKRAGKARQRQEDMRKLNAGMTKAQALARGMLGRKRARQIKLRYLQTLKFGASIITAQRVYRGHRARVRFRDLVRMVSSRNIQRIFRGRIGRKAAQRERDRLDLLRRMQVGACKIQSVWRMKVSKEEFRSKRIHMLAAIEIQRSYRGYLGRKRLTRRRKWESTAPGPDRIKLGQELIEESKVAFERQQEEIDALHRAQERAEARVSHITTDLKDSEREMLILERELQEIDQIERDLMTLTHERELLAKNVRDAAGMPRIANKGHNELVMGKEPSFRSDPDLERRRKAEAYALEMTIQMKRAEREKKRQELETEFAAVFQDVEKKKKALQRLEASLADMESTRERKDREFRRLQKNLMQLLLEQKQELDELREKGIELETATATTAAAATATAQKAKEHEKQSSAMFSQTEELMKFQFMSMSLSYFSSLNMLKQLRDMNADTTSAAVASSADAAAAAAASAAAANLPNMKKLQLGASDVVELSIQKKKAELEAAEQAEKEAKKARANPLPDNVKLWTVADVARWLTTLSLGQYIDKFKEATVDGPFLMELREEDLVDVLAMKHKLHVRKILVSRERLKPLSEQELFKKEEVEREERADKERASMGVPTLDTVFSQVRNGRIKRVEESLNLGFKIDSEDEKGNTMLLVACQNSNRKLVEMLLLRGANVNHQNSIGNTALHYALAFDTEGMLGEYLIEHGADDTLENIEGLTAYDGVGTM